MRAVLRLIKGSHTQTANVTCRVVAGCNRVVGDWIRADKADFAFVIVVGGFRRLARAHGMGSGCRGSDILGCWVCRHWGDVGVVSASSTSLTSSPALVAFAPCLSSIARGIALVLGFGGSCSRVSGLWSHNGLFPVFGGRSICRRGCSRGSSRGTLAYVARQGAAAAQIGNVYGWDRGLDRRRVE